MPGVSSDRGGGKCTWRQLAGMSDSAGIWEMEGSEAGEVGLGAGGFYGVEGRNEKVINMF